MTTMQMLEGGFGLTYLIGAVWFLFLERKAGYTKWRVLATALAPLAVPLFALLSVTLYSVDKFFSRQPKETTKKETDNES